jgi:hypothetical protein
MPFFCASSRNGTKPSHGEGDVTICADAVRMLPAPTPATSASATAVVTLHLMMRPFPF